jgi:ATP-dependent RNA helicase RhlE
MHQDSSSTTFASLKLAPQLLRALVEKGYTHPSPIQVEAIPPLLEGRDYIGCAQTGTGKTAAFALPILHRLAARPQLPCPRRPRALILTPTRELAVQIDASFASYGRYLPLRHAVVFGGVGENPQIRALASGVEIIVATPGRLLDLMQQGCAVLDRVETFVLDEADRMLDMGFAPDVNRIIARLPARRQSLLFSATMPDSILALASRLLHDPLRADVSPVASTVDSVEQRICHVQRHDKHQLLVHTLNQHPHGLALVFSRTKHGANRLADNLGRDGIQAAAIHGNKSQGARQRALEDFRTGRTRVLVATDIAARGIDVKGIALVINFDIPDEPEAYVHRIGRTARMGASGLAFSFCDPSEHAAMRDIQRLIRQTIPVNHDHPFASAAREAPPSPVLRPQPAPGAAPRRFGFGFSRLNRSTSHAYSGFGGRLAGRRG